MLRIIYYVLAILALFYLSVWIGAAMLAIPLIVRVTGYVVIMRLLGII